MKLKYERNALLGASGGRVDLLNRDWSRRYLVCRRRADGKNQTSASAVKPAERGSICIPEIGGRGTGKGNCQPPPKPTAPRDIIRGAAAGRAVSRVLFCRGPFRQMVICLGWPSPATSSSLPAALSVWVTPRRLFGLAPTGGYPATAVTSSAVGSYPTVSPLPSETLRPPPGGFFSVALSSPSGAQAYLQSTMELGLSGTFGTRDHRTRPVV